MSDLIDRQAALNAITDELMPSTPLSAVIRAKNRLKELPSVQPEVLAHGEGELIAQPEPHWIPCSEILPEKNCRCLTTNEAWGSFEVDWNAWIDGQWLYPNEKPVAWMPFPEPYRGGEE